VVDEYQVRRHAPVLAADSHLPKVQELCELLRPLANPSEHLIDIAKKAGAETSLFLVVPAHGLLEIGLRQRPDDEPSGHSI
jgi:hypothetical protein